MNNTEQWLKKNNACIGGVKWFKEQQEISAVKNPDRVILLKLLMKEDKLDWANWAIVRVMKRKQYLAYAIFSAEQVLDIFEKAYPDDKHPRQAIEAAKNVLKNDTPKNRAASRAASLASEAASEAASRASEAASWASEAASEAASRASEAASRAAPWATSWASEAAKKEMQIRILNFGIKLLESRVA